MVQEHIAYRVWTLVDKWVMPKETAVGSSQGGLVYLKYTFRYRDRYDEPNDEWLKCIEATSDELLGAYTRAEDDALTSAFGGRGKKRLNRVFDVIGFVYPDYTYPSRKQGKKRKTSASAISAALNGKKIKILTHRPRYIETAILPKFGEGTSSTAGTEQTTPAGLTAEESTEVPKVPIAKPAEAKEEAAKKRELEKVIVRPEILSPPAEAELSKVTKAPATTPKRRKMVSVLDAVMETTRALTPALAKKVAEAVTARAETEAGPSVPAEVEPAATKQRPEQEFSDTSMAVEKDVAKKAKSPAPEAPSENFDFFVRHASGKRLSEEEIA
jgi:hypothetical protein